MIFNDPSTIFHKEAQRIHQIMKDVISNYSLDSKIVDANEPSNPYKKSMLQIIDSLKKYIPPI